MKRHWFVMVVCGVLASALVLGCGARLEVAKDKVREKIDSLLGSMDVKRKEIEISVAGLREGINGLRRAKIKAQVGGDQIGRQAKPQEERLAAMDGALKTLEGHLETGKAVEIAGKTYSPAELKEPDGTGHSVKEGMCGASGGVPRIPRTVAEGRRHPGTEAAGGPEAVDRDRGPACGDRQQPDGPHGHAAVSGGHGRGDGSLAKSLDKLQDKVNGLYADVEVELRCEDEKWGEVAATKEIDSAEALVATLQNSHGTVAEIDKILGTSKR